MGRQHVLTVLRDHHAYLQKLVSDLNERLRQLEATDAEMRPSAADFSHQLLLLTQCLATEAEFFHRRLQAFLAEDRPRS